MSRLYSELAAWWPLMSAPADYAEEAAFYSAVLESAGDGRVHTVLELGSGGGNNASHMKARFTMTLVEPSDGMRRVSQALNPECEHVAGDMRTVRLGRTFDAVFVHDAVCYMTSEAELRQAMATAALHCRPGGAVLFAPDYLRENFRPSTECGGEDDGARGLRYLEWVWDPNPADCTYLVDYAYLIREGGGTTRVEHDRHVEGLFSRDDWLGWLRDAGFDARARPLEHSELEPGAHEVFAGTRRTDDDAREPEHPR